MIRQLTVAAAVAVIIASSGLAAQSGVADGVTALARGDYQRALEILRPLAEREPDGDAAAQLFLGTMYEGGLGVARDPLRACALYHRAASAGDPFGAAAGRLHKAAFQRHGAAFFAECQLIGNLGFDHRFEPVTFVLDADHAIAWKLQGASITYRGRTSEHPLSLAGRGDIYLPLRYTPIQTSGVAGVQHFVEVFIWHPDSKGLWSLAWHLFEVAGNDLLRIADADGVSTSLERPQVSSSGDVRHRVIVRSTVEGRAEWAILEGPSRRSELIESAEERREIRELEAARRAALDNVDWKRRYDARRLPSLSYATTVGCGQFLLHGVSRDRAEAISVRAERANLQLSTTAPRTFDLAQHLSSIVVSVRVTDRSLGEHAFCSDVSFTEAGSETETWRAVSGRITIEVSAPGVRARRPSMYRATVRLEGAEFMDSSGRRHRQAAPIVLSAVVGSVMG